jgi:cyclopropane fatty-acyl-phospholipid synthase-like methyltransferase
MRLTMDSIIIAVLLVLLDIILVFLVLRGAPFVPTRRAGLERIMRSFKLRPGMKAADIGSGDGRILIELAKAGVEAHGYEINLLLVWWSRAKIRKAGLEKLAFVHWRDQWMVDYSPYDVVTVFGVMHIMRKLEAKLRRELKPGAVVASIALEFPTWPNGKNVDNVFVYEQPFS